MSISPLLAEGGVIASHAIFAIAALALGIAQFALPKGTRVHRWLGGVWVALMGGVALSSFWIHDLRLIGPFSPIHLLSVYTLSSIVFAIRAARRHDIEAHARAMRSLFWIALVGAGLFTLLPGRIMHQVLFGQ